jgi:hypothetical protein
MPLMNIVVKRKFYQDPPELSANLAEQKSIKTYILSLPEYVEIRVIQIRTSYEAQIDSEEGGQYAIQF